MIPDHIKYSFHRAKVVDNEDEQKMGRVEVWIPDVMTFLPDTVGVWARPANNPIGGRNLEDGNLYAGTSYIPPVNSWVWIFFEAGNINRPYYFAACDLENAKALPETQLGSQFYNKWVIFKSKFGRTIVVSDDPHDVRVEITGKKRDLEEPPSGNTDSVYTIDNNQTTILLDERNGKEKILIRTHKGDFLHIDIDEQELHAQFENDIHIKSNNGSIYLTAKNGIHLKAILESLNLQAGAEDVNIKAGGKIQEQSGGDNSTKSGGNVTESATGKISSLAGSVVSHDPVVSDAGGSSKPADDASDATEANPIGERDT